MERFQAAAAEYDAFVTKARNVAVGSFDRLDEPTLLYLAKRFERGLHEGAEEALKDGRRRLNLDGWEWLTDEFREWRREQDFEAVVEHWGGSAQWLLEAHGYRLDPQDTEGFRKLCMALNDAALAASADAQSRLNGHVIPLPPEPLAPVKPTEEAGLSSPAHKTAAAQGTFEQLAESILGNPRERIGPATKQASRTALRFLREAQGEATPAEITRRSVSAFLDLLSQRPAKLPAADRTLPLSQVVKKYEGQVVDRMSVKTLEQHLGSLRALWNKAQSRGDISEDLSNPFKHKIAVGQTTEKAKGLTPDELNSIFRLPVFTSGERPVRGKGEASYWLPLMLLWTGARPEELAQLMIHDVRQDAGSGRWVLQITDEGVHPHKGQRVLKTTAARRTFPLPAKLLELNFLDYVAALRSAGETALFPALRPKGERNLLFAGFGEWWGKYLKEHQVPLAVGKRPAREFRHTWTTAARVCRVPREARIFIQGHQASDPSTNDKYGELDALGLWIDSLEFREVDLSAVQAWRSPSGLAERGEAA